MQNDLLDVQKRSFFVPQILTVCTAWGFITWLHWHNNGLWYGDAPYHAANGLFWKDYLLNLSLDPKYYALSYFARYPVIAPTKYPPIFYLLEAVLFGIVGPSPYIAKLLVLGFTLMAALYTTVWCRRWIAQEAGWAGALIILLPSMVQWSNAIMLNIPTVALSIGALYHFRRWLESPSEFPSWKNLYLGAAMAVLSILTYVTSCVIILIIGTWIIIEKRWSLLWKRRTLIILIISAMSLLPWLIVVLSFERNRIETATGRVDYIISASYWQWALSYYPKCLPQLFGTNILLIALFGIASGILVRRWRHETILLLIIMVICFIFFSYVPHREARYILLMSLPIAILCFIFLQTIVQCINKIYKLTPKWIRIVNLTGVVVLLISQAWLASRVSVPSVSGFKQLIKFIEKVAPNEPVFYDGRSSLIFTFYIQAGDPDYRRRVVLGKKLLYAELPLSEKNTVDFVSSPKEVVEVLKKSGGCKWIVVADFGSQKSKAPENLREAIKGPQFELVKSFPITYSSSSGVNIMNIKVYRFLVPIEQVNEINMPIFSYGEGKFFQIKPIQR